MLNILQPNLVICERPEMRFRPDVITTLELPNGPVHLDEAGFLVDPESWTPEFAQYLAGVEGIKLQPAHWEILQFMRDAWAEKGVAVDARHVFNLLKNKHNIDKSAAKEVFFNLFPYGYVKQAVKMAGMKQPRAWSTG